MIRYYAKVEPVTYFEQRNKNDDVVSSEDEVIGNIENIVNDVKQQWIKGEIYVGYLNMLLVILVILVIFLILSFLSFYNLYLKHVNLL